MNLRAILIISLVVIIVAFGGVLIYFLLNQQPDDETQPPQTTIPGFPSFPGAQTGDTAPPSPLLDAPGNRVARIGAFRARAPAISPDGNRVWFFERETGNLYEANFNGSELTKISSSLLPSDLASIVWSRGRASFAAFFENGANNFIYTFSSGLSTTIAKNIADASFAPQSARIAYHELGAQESTVTVSSTANTNQRALLRAAMGPSHVQWVQESQLSVAPRASGLIPGFVIVINPASGALNQVVRDAHGLTALWSPSGARLLYTTTDQFGRNLSLWLVDASGNNPKKLDITTTADKCVWASDNRTLFCAAPEAWPAESLLPDDYYKGIVSGPDAFLRINTETDAISFVLEPTLVDAQELLITPNEDYLLFINRMDGGFYSIKL